MTLENHFYNWLKVINFGFPTLLYGLAGLIWANHTEQVTVKGNYDTYLIFINARGVINDKAGKADALPKFVRYVNPFSIREGRLRPTIGFASPKFFSDYAPEC